MKAIELYKIRHKELSHNWKYVRAPYKLFDYTVLTKCMSYNKKGRGDNSSYNDIVIMFDTETSKQKGVEHGENYVVAWTISIRMFHLNICTLYGNKPSQLMECIDMIQSQLHGDKTLMFAHNLTYDWTFLRKFFFRDFGYPEKQLNVKSHYPVNIEFSNGLCLRDSLILAQRSLEKWASDLNVEHKKACGKWDYNVIRNQDYTFNNDELEYIECDTLAGVECLDAYCLALDKKIFYLPFTATGIPRAYVIQKALENGGKEFFNKCAPSLQQYKKLEKVYHGGYTHANRHYVGEVVGQEMFGENIIAFDFASSYPFVLLSEKYPCTKFSKCENKSISDILSLMEEKAFMFKLIGVGVKLKNDDIPMPTLQLSKCEKVINPICDNGRIMSCEYCEIYLNEQTLSVIALHYDFQKHLCVEVEYAEKKPLPRWLTDYIFELFKAKTQLKGGDFVLYCLKKAMLNSVYGLCVQHSLSDTWNETIEGEYIKEIIQDEEESYNKYLKRKKSVLLYQTGCWCTSYAFKNLHTLGSFCKHWVYSDTDSCYGCGWDLKKVEEYNKKAKEKLQNNGYDAIMFNGREYCLGVAEFDSESTEFVTLGAKRYCKRSVDDGELHITVAGVPKNKGSVSCLGNDIRNFRRGLIFDGKRTGKLQHEYFYTDSIHYDKYGNEYGDSINLTPCDYRLDETTKVDFDDLLNEEVNIQIYE